MTNAQSKIIFPKSELSKMGTGKTITYEEVQRFRKELLTNLMAIPSDYGNGKMGHTHLFYPEPEYNRLSLNDKGVSMPYVPQEYPGTELAIPDPAESSPFIQRFFSWMSTHSATKEATRQLKLATARWQLNLDVVNATKDMIQQCCDENYYQLLRDHKDTYISVTVNAFVEHFTKRYGRLDSAVLHTNHQTLREPMDLTQPIDFYLNRINTCRRVAATGNDPISDKTTIFYVIDAMTATKQFTTDLAIRENNPGLYPDDNWEAFTEWLCTVDATRRRNMTTSDAGFHGQANHATSLLDGPTAAEDRQLLHALLAKLSKETRPQARRRRRRTRTSIATLTVPTRTPATAAKTKDRTIATRLRLKTSSGDVSSRGTIKANASGWKHKASSSTATATSSATVMATANRKEGRRLPIIHLLSNH